MQIQAAQFLRQVSINAETMSKLAASEDDLVRMDERISRHVLLPAIRRQLLRLEAIASSMIDGTHVSFSDLLRFEAVIINTPSALRTPSSLFYRAAQMGLDCPEGAVSAVLYLEALEWISQNISCRKSVPTDLFQQIISRFDANAIEREAVKWSRIPASEDAFAISEPKKVEEHRVRIGEKEYIDFVNSVLFTPCAQAELSHAMLQAIGLGQHKEDGYERALSHVILYHRGVLTKSVAPLAIGPLIDIERHAESIYQNMSAISTADRDSNHAEYNFDDTAFCTTASVKTMHLVTRAFETMKADWMNDLKLPRNSNKAVARLVDLFFEYGYLTINFASKEMGKSFSTTSAAMQTLVASGLVKEAGHINKHRVFCAVNMVNFFDSLLIKLMASITVTRDEALARIDEHTTRESDRARSFDAAIKSELLLEVNE